MYKILFILFIIGCLTSSCGSKVERVMKGFWTIDTLYFKNYDVRGCYSLNVITFEDNDIKLPRYTSYCDSTISRHSAQEGTWEIIESTNQTDTLPFRIKIISNNDVFKGVHQMVFHRDEVNKLLKIEIWSDSLYMICRKGLFDYVGNEALVRDLEKCTWTTRRN